jgi:NADH-quinone oxidoreductase subunit E
MNHYIVELAAWTLLIFLIGCVLGAVLRHMFGPDEIARRIEPEDEQPAPVAEPAVTPAAPEAVALAEKAIVPEAPATLRMERPKGISEARGGKPDALQRISGIGPKNEKILHTLGFFHFDQIASWTAEQIMWVDDHLKFNGRIGREDWVEQAKLLASGRFDEFEERYGRKRS